MNHEEAGRFWNDNADAWTKLSRAEYDVYRDYLNTHAFFAMLPDVNGLSGLDIGCGEGHNTRLPAQRRTLAIAIDISEVFIAHAKQAEEQCPFGEPSHLRKKSAWLKNLPNKLRSVVMVGRSVTPAYRKRAIRLQRIC
jgi:SAM-dependent methyltransferase